MTQSRGPTAASDAALNLALANWEVPSAHASMQLFAHTAALAKTPVLEAALLDASAMQHAAKALRATNDAGYSFPTIIGSSLSSQIARGGVLDIDVEQLTGVTGAAASLAAVGESIAAMHEMLMPVGRAVREAADAVASTIDASWATQFEQFGQVMSNFVDDQRDLDEETDIFVARHGWPVPTSLPIRAYGEIVAKAHAGKCEVDASMVHWFRPRSRAYTTVREVLDASPGFASRRPLLKQMYAAQRRGHWYLVINYAPSTAHPRSLNRHGILHGAARRYGTAKNATKLFLLVGLLAECLGMYRDLSLKREQEAKRSSAYAQNP
jgi:hypothetical protein